MDISSQNYLSTGRVPKVSHPRVAEATNPQDRVAEVEQSRSRKTTCVLRTRDKPHACRCHEVHLPSISLNGARVFIGG